MVEEAAGTRMYEVKRQAAQKTIEKKDAKLLELKTVRSKFSARNYSIALFQIFEEEIAPKLKKLREEREQFLEYQQLDRELERMLGLFQCWHFCQAQLIVKNTCKNLELSNQKMQSFQDAIQENIQRSKNLEKEIEEMTKNAQLVKQNVLIHSMIYITLLLRIKKKFIK